MNPIRMRRLLDPAHPAFALRPHALGLARLRKIVLGCPMDPVEVALAWGLIARAWDVLDPSHPGARSAAWNALAGHGVDVVHLALGMVILGLVQFVAVLYEWDRVRGIVAALAGSIAVWLVIAYHLFEPESAGPKQWVVMALVQMWVFLRSVPVLSPTPFRRFAGPGTGPGPGTGTGPGTGASSKAAPPPGAGNAE